VHLPQYYHHELIVRPPLCTISPLTEKLDIYSPKGELLAQLAHPDLTTVPAVTAQHPSSSTLQVAGATAGGKIYLWT
jgi:sugar lactone lactonase YvrE